jgi:hypothetical protein
MSEELTQEQRIMRMMRKVLASVIRDTTPQPGMRHTLSETTLEGVRDCLGLIAAREAELAEALGLGRNERPHYVDQKPADTTVVRISSASLRKRNEDTDKH